MNITAFIFYLIATIMVVFSFLSVTSRRILRAAVYLLFTLIGTAALYFMVEYYFLAAVQLLVYAGGILVLILFSILLTSHLSEKLERANWGKIVITAIMIIGGFSLTIYTLINHAFTTLPSERLVFTVEMIGERMLSYGEGGYVLPFEVISILLLAAMVGAIVIAKRTPLKP
jgi:NADH-quinone oxidoreductase subunit J